MDDVTQLEQQQLEVQAMEAEIEHQHQEDETVQKVVLLSRTNFLQALRSTQEEFSYYEMFRLLLAIGVVAAVFFLRHLVVENVVKLIEHLPGLTEEHKRKAIPYLKGPLSFFTVLLAFFLARFLADLPQEMDMYVAGTQHTLFHVLVFWLIYYSVEPIVYLLSSTGTGSFAIEVQQVSVKAGKVLVCVFGILAILQEWGVNVTAFLASFGLFGMAVALAAQDTLQNLFGSICVVADKIFKKGDWVKTPAVEGIVEHFGFRTTEIRGFDDSLITIPNSAVSNSMIRNFSKCRRREVSWLLPLGCPITADQIEQVTESFRAYLKGDHDVSQPTEENPHLLPPIVYIEKFGCNCVQLFVYFYLKETAWIPYLKAKEKILLEFKKLAANAEVSFGVPTQYWNVKKVK